MKICDIIRESDEKPTTVYNDGTKEWRNDQNCLHRIGGPAIISPSGVEEWWFDGALHRDDGPAVTRDDGSEAWYRNGLRHREDGPATVFPNGSHGWAFDGNAKPPLIPIILAAGATEPWHAQPKVVDQLNQPESKKNIMRWLTRTARIGGNTVTAVSALRKLGVAWPELDTFDDATTAINESDYDDGSHTDINDRGAKIWRNAAGKVHRDDGPAMIYPDGSQMWYKNDLRHREDGPAVIRSDGYQAWYRNGNRHREDGPAMTNPNGEERWFRNGMMHRVNGPAVTYPNGTQGWYMHGNHFEPLIPMLLSAGAYSPWHAQPEVVANLNEPEIKKNIMRWLTRTARAGGDVDTAINALREIGVKWPELETFTSDTGVPK